MLKYVRFSQQKLKVVKARLNFNKQFFKLCKYSGNVLNLLTLILSYLTSYKITLILTKQKPSIKHFPSLHYTNMMIKKKLKWIIYKIIEYIQISTMEQQCIGQSNQNNNENALQTPRHRAQNSVLGPLGTSYRSKTILGNSKVDNKNQQKKGQYVITYNFDGNNDSKSNSNINSITHNIFIGWDDQPTKKNIKKSISQQNKIVFGNKLGIRGKGNVNRIVSQIQETQLDKENDKENFGADAQACQDGRQNTKRLGESKVERLYGCENTFCSKSRVHKSRQPSTHNSKSPKKSDSTYQMPSLNPISRSKKQKYGIKLPEKDPRNRNSSSFNTLKPIQNAIQKTIRKSENDNLDKQSTVKCDKSGIQNKKRGNVMGKGQKNQGSFSNIQSSRRIKLESFSGNKNSKRETTGRLGSIDQSKIKSFPQKQQYRNGRTIQHKQIPKISIKTQQKYLRQQKQHPNSSMTTKPKLTNESPTKHLSPRSYLSPQQKKLEQKSPSKQSGKKIFNTSDQRLWSKKQGKGNRSDGVGDGHGYDNRGSNCSQLEGEKEGKEEESGNFCDYGADTLKLIQQLEKMEEEESSRVSDLKNDKKKVGDSNNNSRRVEKRQLQSRSLNNKQNGVSASKEKEFEKNQINNESKNHKKNKSSSQHLELKQKLGNKDKKSEQKTKIIRDQNKSKQKRIGDCVIQNKQNKTNKLQKQPSKQQQQQAKIPINNININNQKQKQKQKQKSKTVKKQENSMQTNSKVKKEQNVQNKDSELLSNVLNKSKSDIRVDDDEDQGYDGNEKGNRSGQYTNSNLVKDHEISGQLQLQSNNKQYNNSISLNNSNHNEIQPKNQDINVNTNIKYLKKDIIKPQVSIVAQRSQKNLSNNDNINIMKLKLANKQVQHEIMSKGEIDNGGDKMKEGFEMGTKVGKNGQKSKQGSQKLLISSNKDITKANKKQTRQASSTKQIKSTKNQPEHKQSQKKLQSQQSIKGNANNNNKSNGNPKKQSLGLKQANEEKEAKYEQMEGSNKKEKEDIINEKKDECLQTVQMLSPRSQLDLKSKQINLKIAASKLENVSKKEIKSNKQITQNKQIKSNKEISKDKQIDLTKVSENKQKLQNNKQGKIIEGQNQNVKVSQQKQKGIYNSNTTQNLVKQTKQVAKSKFMNDSNQVNLSKKSDQKQVEKIEDKKLLGNSKQSDQMGEKQGQQQSTKKKEEQIVENKIGNNQLKKPSSGAAIFRKKPDSGDKNLELTNRQSQKPNNVEQRQQKVEIKKQSNNQQKQNKHQLVQQNKQKRSSIKIQDKKSRTQKEQRLSSKSSNRQNKINSKKQQRTSSKSSTNRQTAEKQEKKKQQQVVVGSKGNQYQCKKQEKESYKRQEKDNKDDKVNKDKENKQNDKMQVNNVQKVNMDVKSKQGEKHKKTNNVHTNKSNTLKTAQKRQSNQTKRQSNIKNKKQSQKSAQLNKSKSNNPPIPIIQPNSAHQSRNSYAESDSDLETTPNLQHSQAPKEITCISKRSHANNQGTERGVNKEDKLMGKVKEFKDACVNVQMGKMQVQGQGEDNLYSFANITCQPKIHDSNKQSFLDISHTDKLNNTDFPHQKPIQRKFNTKFSTPPSTSTRAPILSYIYTCTSPTKPPILPTPYPLSSQPLPFNIKQNYSLNEYEEEQAYKNDAIYKAMKIVLSIDNWLLQRIVEPFLDQDGIGLVWLFCRGCWRCFRSGSYVSESCFFREAIGRALGEFYDGQDSNYVGVQEILRMLTGFRLLQLRNKKKLSQQLQYQLKKGNLIKGLSSSIDSPIYSITGIQQTKSKQNLIRIQQNLSSIKQQKYTTSDNIKWIKQETFEKYFQYFVLICYRQENYWTQTVLPKDYKVNKQIKDGKKGETMVFTMDSLVNAIGSVEVHGQGQFGCKMDLYREIKPKVLKFIGCVNQKNKPKRSTSNPNPTIYFNFSLKGRYYLMLTVCQQKNPTKINLSIESSNKIQFNYLQTIQEETLKNKTSQYLEVDNKSMKQMQHSGNKSLNVSIHTNKSKNKRDKEREYGFGDGRDKESIREEFIKYLITGEQKD